jgi:hypothetical protein
MAEPNPRPAPPPRIGRRGFAKALAGTAGGAFGFQVVPASVFGANSRVQLACVGVGGKGAGEVSDNRAAGAVIVGLCDVDRPALEKSGRENPGAKCFADFREMFHALGDRFDAVTVSTPDHTHSMRLMGRSGWASTFIVRSR